MRIWRSMDQRKPSGPQWGWRNSRERENVWAWLWKNTFSSSRFSVCVCVLWTKTINWPFHRCVFYFGYSCWYCFYTRVCTHSTGEAAVFSIINLSYNEELIFFSLVRIAHGCFLFNAKIECFVIKKNYFLPSILKKFITIFSRRITL